MNTPPPDSEFIKPEPVPSMSMPVLQPLQVTIPTATTTINRPRRHTITRPDSALALLSDSDDGDNEDPTLDRITDILANLIQEANEAVQNNCTSLYSHARRQQQRSRSTLLKSSQSTTSSQHRYNNNNNNNNPIRPKSSVSISRLPRPTRQLSKRIHNRTSSNISLSSSSTSLFSPVPNFDSPNTASSVEQLQLDDHSSSFKQQSLLSLLSTSTSPSSTSLHLNNNSTDDKFNSFDDDDDKERQYNDELLKSTSDNLSDPLLESFRRLDSSMAMVESLSRDLEEEFENNNNNNNNNNATLQNNSSFINTSTSTSKLTLLLLPLLHIPHAILTTVFDHLSTNNNNNNNIPTSTNMIISSSSTSSSSLSSSSTFSGMLAWAFFFAMANMVITWSGVSVPRWFLNNQQEQMKNQYIRSRRLSLPGSYHQKQQQQRETELDHDFISFYNNNNNNSLSPSSSSLNHYQHGRIMVRSNRPSPINTNLTLKQTPTKRSNPPISSSSRKRTTSYQHPSNNNNDNDKSYTLFIQQSRKYYKLQQQQLDTHENNITLRRRCSL